MRTRTRRGIVPYDPRLTQRARESRKNSTESEAKLWQVIRKRKIKGFKFLRQKPVHTFILDFYCSQLLLGIEVDGSSHKDKRKYDDQRDLILKGFGITVLRFTNDEIDRDINEVVRRIREATPTVLRLPALGPALAEPRLRRGVAGQAGTSPP
jgi:very-short-patch-repair endonuclease